MKVTPLFGLLFLPLAAFGRDTAYQALRTVGAERDQALLSRVIEVKGRDGQPQPENWVVVLDDPLARGGVREIEVANKHIVSERTPVKAYSGSSAGSAMNFQKLNLDSQGAFVIAEEQAKKAKISFDAVDYLLRRDEANGAPVWTLQLLDPRLHRVASITLAADTGAVLASDFAPPAQQTRIASAPEEDSDTHSVRDGAKNLGHKINRTFHRVGASMEEFFTGKRTIDRRYRDE